MRFRQVRTIAKERGIDSARLGKADLIRVIQRDEGNFPCFGTSLDGVCDQTGCAWRGDCIPTGNTGRRKK